MWEIVIPNVFTSQFYYVDCKELLRKWFLLSRTFAPVEMFYFLDGPAEKLS